jgi:tetratricopeptide (TPR) repeat protein
LQKSGKNKLSWRKYRKAQALDGGDQELRQEMRYVEYYYRPRYLGGRRALDEAEHYANEALTKGQENPRAWLLLGDVQRARGHVVNALQSFENALRYDPTVVSAWLQMGVLKERMGRKLEAIADYERALEIAPTDYCALSLTANGLEAQGRLRESLSVLEAALKHNPEILSTYDRIGRVLLKAGRPVEALKSDSVLLERLRNHTLVSKHELHVPWIYRVDGSHLYFNDIPDKAAYIKCRMELGRALLNGEQPAARTEAIGNTSCRDEPFRSKIDRDLSELLELQPNWSEGIGVFRARHL